MGKLLTFTAQILLIHVTWTLVAAYHNLVTQTTVQSTTGIKSDGTALHSSVAVDGNRNQDGNKIPYCAQTLHQTQSWWNVQMLMSSHINEIRIWLRNDGWGATQPWDYDIYLSDSGTCGTGTHCVRHNPIGGEMTVTCAGVGHWVVICGYTTKEMRIILCEVEIYGCPEDNYGDECLYQCGNCLDSPCSLDNGYCPGECQANYWGDKCSEKCPVKCSDPACRQSDGICNGCVSGYWDDKCSEACPDKCNDLACRQSDGICTGCVFGYWGDKCSEECPDKCSDLACRQSDGMCTGCVSGYWGDKCSEACPDTCSDPACRQRDGICSGCMSGYWGDMCSDKCSDGCDEQGCMQFSGICFDCDDGHWGENCSKSCPNCKNNVCDQNNGMCSHGCFNDSFWGTHCKPCPDKCAGDICKANVVAEENSGVDIVSGAVGVVIGALAVIMVMLIFLLRRRLHRQNKSKATTDSTDTIEGRGGTDMYNSLSSNRDVHDYDSITTVT